MNTEISKNYYYESIMKYKVIRDLNFVVDIEPLKKYMDNLFGIDSNVHFEVRTENGKLKKWHIIVRNHNFKLIILIFPNILLIKPYGGEEQDIVNHEIIKLLKVIDKEIKKMLKFYYKKYILTDI